MLAAPRNDSARAGYRPLGHLRPCPMPPCAGHTSTLLPGVMGTLGHGPLLDEQTWKGKGGTMHVREELPWTGAPHKLLRGVDSQEPASGVSGHTCSHAALLSASGPGRGQPSCPRSPVLPAGGGCLPGRRHGAGRGMPLRCRQPRLRQLMGPGPRLAELGPPRKPVGACSLLQPPAP